MDLGEEVGEEVEITVLMEPEKNQVCLSFSHLNGTHELVHSYDNVDVDRDIGSSEDAKIIGYTGKKKTEFRLPFQYQIPKQKGRDFWNELVKNGWVTT